MIQPAKTGRGLEPVHERCPPVVYKAFDDDGSLWNQARIHTWFYWHMGTDYAKYHLFKKKDAVDEERRGRGFYSEYRGTRGPTDLQRPESLER